MCGCPSDEESTVVHWPQTAFEEMTIAAPKAFGMLPDAPELVEPATFSLSALSLSSLR